MQPRLLNELSLFVRALEAGSFTRAAQGLGVPKLGIENFRPPRSGATMSR